MKANILIIIIVAATITACGEVAPQNAVVERPVIVVSEEVGGGSNQSGDASSVKPPAAPFYNSYSVTLEVNPANRKLTAIEKITYNNQTGTTLDKIYVQFNIAAFSKSERLPFFEEHRDKVFKYGVSYSDYLINLVTINNESAAHRVEGRYVEITLANPLPPAQSIEIAMQFECAIPKICHRIGANDDALWLGNLIPMVARFEKGKWQLAPYFPAGNPFVSEVSNFDVTITTPKEYEVFGTGIENVTENKTNKTTRITINMVRDFAFVISSKFKSVHATSNSGVNINFYYYSANIAPSRVSKVLELAVTAVDYYYHKIGAYPFQEIDIAETELFMQGGCEFPNMIFLDSGYLKNTINFESVTHDIAHQWFYNVTGNNQITEGWIDEGLTTYAQTYIFESILAVDRKMADTYGNLSQELANADNYALTTSLGAYETWQDYYNVEYLRAALMFHALQKKMGSIKFDEFLKTYYSEFSFKIATKKDLVDIASNIYGERLDDFFESWISWKELPNLP